MATALQVVNRPTWAGLALSHPVRKTSRYQPYILAGTAMLVLIVLAMALFREVWNTRLAEAQASRTAWTIASDSLRCPASLPCGVRLSEVAQQMADNAFGIPSSEMALELEYDSGTVSCVPLTKCIGDPVRLRTAAGGSYAKLNAVKASVSYRPVIPFMEARTVSARAVSADATGTQIGTTAQRGESLR